jgi:chaperonin GroEL
MKEKKDRVDDAQQATAAAVEEGIVPGGGVAYIRCIDEVLTFAQTLEGDEKTGARIIANSLSAPLRQIAENGGKEGAIVIQQVKSRPENEGYDALNDIYVDMIKAGILDPTKVARCALENAASIAAMLLTTEAIIAEAPEDKDSAAAMSAGGMEY